MATAINFTYWILLFSSTALPGSKLYAGLSLGLAETTSILVTGVICRYFKETHVFNGACVLTLISQSTFMFYCGGESTSFTAMVAIFGICLGNGAAYSIIYLMMELRFPPEIIGSYIVKVITTSLLFASMSTHIAYMP